MGLMIALTITVNSSKSDQSEVEGCSSISICNMNINMNIQYGYIYIYNYNSNRNALHEVALDKSESFKYQLNTAYQQSTGRNYRKKKSNLPHGGHEKRRSQLSKITEPADAGGYIRVSAAEDKTYRGAVRRTIMMPEMDEVSTTHARAERHRGDKAARKLESQRRAAEKASREHDLAKTRNVNKQQREDEEYTAS